MKSFTFKTFGNFKKNFRPVANWGDLLKHFKGQLKYLGLLPDTTLELLCKSLMISTSDPFYHFIFAIFRPNLSYQPICSAISDDKQERQSLALTEPAVNDTLLNLELRTRVGPYSGIACLDYNQFD